MVHQGTTIYQLSHSRLGADLKPTTSEYATDSWFMCMRLLEINMEMVLWNVGRFYYKWWVDFT